MSNKRIKDSGSERLTASVIKAVGLHLLVVILLFVSFSTAPTFEPAKPIIQATLVQLNSKSPATSQTEQRIAGEAERTAAQRHEAEELERRQQEQQKEQESARAAEQQRQAEAARAAEQKAAEQKAAEQKAAEERRQAEQVEKQKAEEARRADAARKLAAEEAAKKKAAEEQARRKAAEEAKRKEEQARKQRAAEEAKRKAEAERVARLKREQEEARARALADLLAEETQYQRAQADQIGDDVAASYDDVIRRYVSSQWRRPPTARNGMVVEVRISMLPSGDITDAVVVRSSGDPGFDQSAIQAVRNVGRIPEMQQLSRENPATFDRLYRQRNLRFKPEDLDF